MRVMRTDQPHRFNGSRHTGANAEVRVRPTSHYSYATVVGPNARFYGANTTVRRVRHRLVEMRSPEGREILEQVYGLGGADAAALDRLGGLVWQSAAALAQALQDGSDRGDWLAEGERLARLVDGFPAGDAVTRAEQARGSGVLRTALDRVSAWFYQAWTRADAEAAVDAAMVTGRHIQGLAFDDVESGNLERPNAIAAGRAEDERVGATESSAAASQAEAARLAALCESRSREEWLLAAGRLLPDVGQDALADQYEATCQRRLPGVLGLPWWAYAAGALALVAVTR